MEIKKLAGGMLLAATLFSACKKDKTTEEVILPYDVPATYNFSGANYASSATRVSMMLELDGFMKSATSTKLDAVKATNLFNNTNNPFANAALNTSGLKLADKTADATAFKGYIDELVKNSQKNDVMASEGTEGYIERSATSKIIVGTNGYEYGQITTKGMMGSLFFKQAMDLLSAVRSDATIATQQQHWDEAFGYLAVPTDYTPEKNYDAEPLKSLSFPKKPALWGGYLAERGKNIEAGKIIFNAFLKGRAAIAAKDVKVRDQAITDIQATWEKLAANAAYAYVTIPQESKNVGKLGIQAHYLSEAYGFVIALKYRVKATSKLSDADYTTLYNIISTNDAYALINENGFTKLKQAALILKTSYGLPD
ncbi:DUF4856 domain-containing protein [Pedobacter endophyticus]|uniref:DUF4856 domain-containing protein n=1 Tax=Pedobacter endophyticus TaxID=2789740 RepID=A0A7S9KYP7_9SPHI|nr:DUF4856 domain-containing protein [Pedobacter endophyticus]QPH39284.1 DUF4856 domain-containing protein [Pedobacter endophyticus]